jgi:GGDEF domain-containing protein
VKYERFEWLTIGVGAAAVFGTLGMTALRGTAPGWDMIIEMIAQLLLLVVLVGAVHWGRKGGFIAALGCTVAYILLRVPTIQVVGITPEVIELVLLHTITYGVVGILGGEICSRIKYYFARFEDAFNIDEDSRVYNQRFLAQLLVNNLAQHRRYGTIFSIGVLTLSPNLTADLRASKVTTVVRTVANHIRNDVRLIDDVGRLDDGRFVLVFPHTPKEGGDVAMTRVRSAVRDLLGAKDESVAGVVYGVPDDADAVQALADSLQPEEQATAVTQGA